MSKHNRPGLVNKMTGEASEFGPPVPIGMTPAYFTARELDELRKICRDADSELGRRFLQAGLDRAGAKPVIRPVDGMT